MDDIEIVEQQAIDAAMNLQWTKAVELNKAIVKRDKTNGSAYLRLGFAYMQMKNISDAKKYYSKALKILPKNTIAVHNLEKIAVLEHGASSQRPVEFQAFDPDLFIEIQGKTKIVLLSRLGQKNILANLNIGEQVYLKIKRRKVEVRTKNDEYIGALPDDLSKRMIFFLRAKSEYTAYIKESTITKTILFIREEKKGKAVAHYPSFPQNIQKNMEELASEEDKIEEEDQEEVVDTWEKIVSESVEEKEELVGIHTEDLDEEGDE